MEVVIGGKMYEEQKGTWLRVWWKGTLKMIRERNSKASRAPCKKELINFRLKLMRQDSKVVTLKNAHIRALEQEI